MLATGPARAASPTWLEAQTPHFTIYSDGSEAVLGAYADSLIGRRRYREATVMLTPLANNPHASGGAKAAQAMLAKIPAEPAS